jgi:hypothetical protein
MPPLERALDNSRWVTTGLHGVRRHYRAAMTSAKSLWRSSAPTRHPVQADSLVRASAIDSDQRSASQARRAVSARAHPCLNLLWCRGIGLRSDVRFDDDASHRSPYFVRIGKGHSAGGAGLLVSGPVSHSLGLRRRAVSI